LRRFLPDAGFGVGWTPADLLHFLARSIADVAMSARRTEDLRTRRSRSSPSDAVAPGDDQEFVTMPKLKTHKGIKKRFKVSANGKVSHKRCGSSHLMSHKNGKQVRRLRKKSVLKVEAEAHRLRRAVHKNEGVNPVAVEVAKQAELADAQAESSGDAAPP